MDEPKWKDTFHYTQSERKGIFVFLLLIIILLAARPMIERLHQPTQVDFSAFKKAIQEFETSTKAPAKKDTLFVFNPNTASQQNLERLGIARPIAQRIIKYRKKGGRFQKKEDLQKIYGFSKEKYKRLASFVTIPKPKMSTITATKKPTRPLQPHSFNPNKVSREALLNMGLSPKIVQQWLRYREKGGRFKQASDLAKLYALQPATYKQLEPYIQIPPPKAKAKYYNDINQRTPLTAYNRIEQIKIDVNKATIQEWQQLKGIGPYYAKKIIAFRQKLGGFASIEQISTTYKLPDSTYLQIQPHLVLSPVFKVLPTNTATIDILAAHPYIQKRQAKAIVNYRKNHGPFKNWEALRKVRVLSGVELERIRPYLEF